MAKACKTCGITKSMRKFSMLGQSPPRYKDDCRVCCGDHEAAALALELKARKQERAQEQQVQLDLEAEQQEVERVAKEIHEKTIRHRAKNVLAMQRTRARRKKLDSEQEQELARRVLARRRLIHCIQRFQPNYLDGWVHHDICRRLDLFLADVAAQKSPRLMLFMPPRHGKSLIASDHFPAYALGKHPEFEIIAASYAVSLPIGFSRKVRDRIADPAYKALFPDTKLDPKSTAAEQWLTTAGGGYVAAGVGGGITGKGSHILVIDDPVKDAEEADSETHREKVWDWWGSTAKTRLAPGGGVLIIQTRWNDADLSGKLIQKMADDTKDIEGALEIEHRRFTKRTESSTEYAETARRITDLNDELRDMDHWEIVSYPAIATHDEYLDNAGKVTDTPAAETTLLRKQGEALHPQRFPLSRLRNMKRSMQPRHWSALYQQNPVPEEGAHFTKSMIRLNKSPPNHQDMHFFAAWDLAIGEKQTNDYTVGVVGGLDWDDQLHIVDVVRGRFGDPATISQAILDVHAKYACQKTGIERGQLYLSVMPQLQKDIRKRKLAVTFDEELLPISDKSVRSKPLQGRMQSGMVDFWHTQPWFEDVQHELLRFPGGVHDDIVDALAWLVRMVLKQQPPRPRKAARQKSWKDQLSGLGAEHKSPMAA